MKPNNLKIGTQLKISFTALLSFVILLGFVSFKQTNDLHMQTKGLYEHPIRTRRAVSEITSNILIMRINIRDYLLNENALTRQNILAEMAVNQENVPLEVAKLRVSYLGSQTDIDDFFNEFTKWVSMLDESIRIADKENLIEARLLSDSESMLNIQALKVMSTLDKINDFALAKGDELYNKSKELNKSLNRQLIVLIMAIILLSLLINYILLRSIRKPIDNLIGAAHRFHNGDMNARSNYESQNEFGELSASFNTLAEGIQVKAELDEKVVSLASLMLSKYEAKEFFMETLNALLTHTNSQLAAVYLLSEDKKTFEHFESIGVDDNARLSFDANRLEGEFGAALSTHNVQHIKNIPNDTRFVFHTVSGKFIPHEIITIPILTDNEVVAIISLASINKYSNQSVQLINNIFITLRARVEGIIAYHKMRTFSKKLEQQNGELEAQKSILASQSAELMEQNTELEMQKNQLGEANRLKTNFLSNMSHELRTPLNSVIALSGVLNRRLANKIPTEEYSYIDVIERNGKHLLDLINDILDISRIEAGHEEIEITEFNVNNLINELIVMIQPQAELKNIDLLNLSTEPNITVKSDANKCHHIIQNLIGNAVKFTENGKVEVIVRENNNRIEISVTDTGIGISESQLPHIFDEFRQADGSTSRRYGGTGLGLAIAKKYANFLGGTVTVKSTLNQGSVFTLILPLHYASENQVYETEPLTSTGFNLLSKATPQKITSVKTILLVEDSEPAIVQIKDMLEEYGYNILVARDGSEALEIIAKTIPDAMILDLMMPLIDGFEVLKIIREAERTTLVPVLILTAKHITKEELKFLKQNNIHQLIQKGDVNRNELLNALATMVSPTEIDLAKSVTSKLQAKPTVLVVEDNPDNMITVKALLANTYTILEAVNGHESIEMTELHKPNLILMDIALPDIDGIEVFKSIRNNVKLQHIPVIALTASAMTRDREAILAHGFDAYISKPIDEKIFFKIINETLYGK